MRPTQRRAGPPDRVYSLGFLTFTVFAALTACTDATRSTTPRAPDLPLRAMGSSATCAPMPAGMTHWWMGEGDARDIVGGSTGALSGTTLFAPGMVRQAFSFDGTSGSLQLGNVLSVGSGTVELWLNRGAPTSGLQGYFGAVALEGGQFNRTPTFFTSSNFGAPDELLWEFGNLFEQHTGVMLPPNSWHHLAMTWQSANDGTTAIRVYVDGALVGSGSAMTSFPDLPAPVVGAYGNNGSISSFGHGAVDEVTLYDRPLSGSEIGAIASAGAFGKCGLPQTVTITSTPPSPAVVGGSYTLSATGGPSGDPITFASTTPSVCTVSGDLANFVSYGSCVVVARQAAAPGYAAGEASQSIQVVFPFAGFFAPVKNAPGVNFMNPGRAVPIGFSLGGDRGLAILAAGSPASQEVSCTTGKPIGALQSAASPGNNTLAFVPELNQYLWVWKTEKAWAGTCRDFSLTLVDGTTHTAHFSFRTSGDEVSAMRGE